MLAALDSLCSSVMADAAGGPALFVGGGTGDTDDGSGDRSQREQGHGPAGPAQSILRQFRHCGPAGMRYAKPRPITGCGVR